MEPVHSGCTFPSRCFDFCSDNQLAGAGNLSRVIHHREMGTNVPHRPNQVLQSAPPQQQQHLLVFSDCASKGESLPLTVLNTHIRQETAVCENSGRAGLVSQTDAFYPPVLHRFGPGNHEAPFLIGSRPGAALPGRFLLSLTSGRKEKNHLPNCAPSVLTCGAITRKRDPGAGERRPRDPSAADP